MSISELLLDVISEFYETDNRATTFGTGTELYHSEIHMLQCIADHPALHISGLARLLEVTRGAASQTAKRLERKEMIVKKASPENEKMVVLRLTIKGIIAVEHHKKAHEHYDAMIGKVLKEAKPDQINFLADFLREFEKSLKEEKGQRTTGSNKKFPGTNEN